MPSTRSRRALRRINPRSARLGAAIAVVTGAGVAAGAVPAAAQLQAPTSAHPQVPATLLHRGSKGPAVKRVQHALHVRPSGHYTRHTRRAVMAFQRKDGLLVDGIVGPQTWDTLFHITPQPTAAPSAATSGASGSSSGSGYSIPSSIVQCESGGNYSAVNPTTGAGGAYQILPSTWQAYGGQGLPQDASPAEQGRIASEIYSSQGSSAWTC
jgi:peptidoglycan hydrolase-like protein with peptidoglycan-binding domain